MEIENILCIYMRNYIYAILLVYNRNCPPFLYAISTFIYIHYFLFPFSLFMLLLLLLFSSYSRFYISRKLRIYITIQRLTFDWVERSNKPE